MIGLPAGTQIWVAAGATDMRKGFDTLCAIAQETRKEDPFSGIAYNLMHGANA
jgi:transposase